MRGFLGRGSVQFKSDRLALLSKGGDERDPKQMICKRRGLPFPLAAVAGVAGRTSGGQTQSETEKDQGQPDAEALWNKTGGFASRLLAQPRKTAVRLLRICTWKPLFPSVFYHFSAGRYSGDAQIGSFCTFKSEHVCRLLYSYRAIGDCTFCK